ncbi:MAG: helix-hairpin-helix domain-containing protein [Thermotaleaceae bacterium]
MDNNFTKKEVIVILIIVLILVSLLTFKLLSSKLEKEARSSLRLEEVEEDLEEETETIMVHISGQVKRPGLVELKAGMRLKDAIDQAGGLKEAADMDRINLARKLSDEEKIYIPAKGEEIDIGIDLSITEKSEEGKININNCSKEELMGLPGIGEVLAQRIIDHREENPFESEEDLMQVAGIGEKRFDDLKELITVK